MAKYEISVQTKDGEVLVTAAGPLELVNYAARTAKTEMVPGPEYNARLTRDGEVIRSVAGDAEIVSFVLSRTLRAESKTTE